jgi:hypothetical protein
VVGQSSAEKVKKPTSTRLTIMTKHILLLAAVLGFIAQSSVFAADAAAPSPSPSASAPKKSTSHHHKHHKAAAPKASPSASPKA